MFNPFKKSSSDNRPVSEDNRATRRARAFRKRTPEEIRKGIFPDRTLERGIQRSAEATHKQTFVKETRKSRAGVKYTVYKPLIVKK